MLITKQQFISEACARIPYGVCALVNGTVVRLLSYDSTTGQFDCVPVSDEKLHIKIQEPSDMRLLLKSMNSTSLSVETQTELLEMKHNASRLTEFINFCYENQIDFNELIVSGCAEPLENKLIVSGCAEPLENKIKKYTLLSDDTISINSTVLYRIKAVRSFNDVKKGDLGGYVQSENNLSHDDDCWIYDNSSVFDNAKVSGNASIHGESQICGYAKVYGYAQVNSSIIKDKAEIYDEAFIEDSTIKGSVKVNYKSEVKKSYLRDKCAVIGNSLVVNSHIGDMAIIDSSKAINAQFIGGMVTLRANSTASNWVVIKGGQPIYENVVIDGCVKLNIWDEITIHQSDILIIQQPWAKGKHLAYIKKLRLFTDATGVFYDKHSYAITLGEDASKQFLRFAEYCESL